MAQERNDGIDLLRIISMFLVVTLHVLGQGGVMLRISSHPATYYVVWFLETAGFCAVNCYGLISGYVGVSSRFRLSRLLELWLTVEFYTLGITLILGIFHPGWITAEVLLQSFFPVMWKTYWYFSGYAALQWFTPFLNRMLLSLERKERRRLMLAIFLVFSLWTMIPKIYGQDFLSLSGGYTFLWLGVLYVFGGCLRLETQERSGSPGKRRGLGYLGGYGLCVLLSWGSKILIENHTRKIYGEARYGRLLVTYHAPTIFLCGVFLVLFFAGLSIRAERLRRGIRLLTPLVFSVYIIHTHPLIWDHLMKNAFRSWAYLSPWIVLFPVLGAALLIFALCLGIDALRRKLFELLGVRRRLERLDSGRSVK